MARRPSASVVLFAATVFLSAGLVFQLQPLIAKYVLPWFGGTPAVWTVCLLFFQVGLFFGYAYAMLTTQCLSAGWQAAVHAGLLVAALAVLPITPDARWKPEAGGDPTWRILQLLVVSVGLPYFLLSATGPLLQAWFALVRPQLSPYPLYALSNLGSLLGLISYPFLVEPAFGADQQTRVWSWCFLAFVVGCSACGAVVWRARAEIRSRRAAQAAGGAAGGAALGAARPRGGQLAFWFCLAMVPSVLLLASTNLVCTDVAVVPFLWVLPLILYLLSFIFCFHDLRWCPRGFWAIAWAVTVAATVHLLHRGIGVGSSHSIPVQVAVLFGLLFCCAMLCHGELARSKPDPAHLTTFYLTIAAGGAAGGIFVGLVAPRVFPVNIEVSIAMLACTLLVLIAFFQDPASRLRRGRPRWAWSCLLLAVTALAAAQAGLFQSSLVGVQEVHRNFFGVLQVRIEPAAAPENGFVCQLIHGRTMHGMQLTDADKRSWPTAYYGPQSGIGLLLGADRPAHPRRVGVVGLGVGTLAAYAQPGDHFCFYEINPDVIELARRFFEYLSQCQGTTDVIEGDARIVLEQQSPQSFDVLVLDAFSSDSIPVHLLTQEAFSVYLRQLKQDGVLAVHISNVHLDLGPVVAAHCDHFGLAVACVESLTDDRRQTRRAVWMLLSRNERTLETEAIRRVKSPLPKHRLVWTDQRNSVFQALRVWSSDSDGP